MPSLNQTPKSTGIARRIAAPEMEALLERFANDGRLACGSGLVRRIEGGAGEGQGSH